MTGGDFILAFLSAILAIWQLSPILLKFQTGGYKLSSVFRRNKQFVTQYKFYFIISSIFTVIGLVGIWIDDFEKFFFILALLFYIAQMFAVYVNSKIELKKPLSVTRRVLRLYALSITISLMLFCVILFNLYSTVYFEKLGKISFIFYPVVLPIVAYLCLIISTPFEKLNNLRYIKQSTKKLALNPNLIKIGITGSYGKTSVKNILVAMLSKDYNVLATQGNYNTPLGIAKTVADLDSYVNVFIAEMGARHVGDIARLVKIVKPKYGIVTGIAPQHLETFKSLENIYKEKITLLESLPKEGAGVINATGLELCEILSQARIERVGNPDALVYAQNIKSTEEGTEFSLSIGGKSYSAKTALLGEHNVQNIVTAATLAHILGVSPENILYAICSLQPVAHRLQVIKGAVKVIDDSYNSNPIGAKAALKVLAQFSGRKIIITPGMIELGALEAEENKTFGHEIAEVADIVILIGRDRVRPIFDGLLENGFDFERIKRFDTLFEAEKSFPQILREGDVVLFENDLPDSYNE